MLNFLVNNLATIIISLVLVGVVVLVIVKLRHDKKSGKGCPGCSESCSGCPSSLSGTN